MKKKLFKSSTDKKIMGVCGGIAEYFNIDSTLVRLGFAISFFALSAGFWPYLLLGIILPYDYQVNRVDGYVYRNDESAKQQRSIFNDLKKTQAPKDVTPKNDDSWSDF
ncbi:PspC domain-containing protein [Tuanshanicoccus lijuaniae]|uniref:PspC domain-containing protein n=1 Tax=Aerococcaceae bacterium zg-1292 TaxID=2774330 RepID=UPI0019387148|nr:PspC domain-containing protein [Aerococcaceae bacterium zg-1292]MBF6626837.1 PspC domain-containing protein [Aerococcaceae bacterium zg-BR9]MBF6978769.1 PspC domain-containing protein [Aerococcaceae bacterium zg-BR22]MBS4456782.1 PspC domain-containing protein [Aerococcaceae bacterium zg-A91]MBS4458574.1 PspC domain-containing protein [Aerococcaceae bacterium zg-BR33]